MGKNILAIAFILCVFGLLVLNRVDLGPQVNVRVARDTGKTYSIGQTFHRGETIRTGKGQFVSLWIGALIHIDLDENTNLELKSLSKNAVRIKFGHGRILVNVNENDGGNLEVDTPTAEHHLIGRASFIGYDFNHATSVIPMFIQDTGSIQTTIPLLNQTLSITQPIMIHDANPPSIENISFDEKTDARAEFYQWTKQK